MAQGIQLIKMRLITKSDSPNSWIDQDETGTKRHNAAIQAARERHWWNDENCAARARLQSVVRCERGRVASRHRLLARWRNDGAAHALPSITAARGQVRGSVQRVAVVAAAFGVSRLPLVARQPN